jgi:hypothetical protein
MNAKSFPLPIAACVLLCVAVAMQGAAAWDMDAELEAEWRADAQGKPIRAAREAVQRGKALAVRLGEQGADLAAPKASLDALAALEKQLGLSPKGDAAKEALYFEVRKQVRAIAFQNPLLDFDELLFIKRHHAKGVFHMCDQYYGFNAQAGGGLYTLRNPFSDNPTAADLLAGSAVKEGRLAGQSLAGGAFLSPELSYDGKTIYFAHSQAQGKEFDWTPTSSYHVFKVNADGSDLEQLTDGLWNDFDPCELPNGRLAFVSERRGGYLRCGRHCPTYTLYSMGADGGEMAPLSYHETHEWHPSVNNDGMLVYTRWDYVDRDTNVAHHIWTSFPDGRDPRTSHGNYPGERKNRPWMEMSIRAIPGSHRYVATAAAHHGHAFGSLVMIDPHQEDDNAMGQLTRLTPDAPFPEAEAKPPEAMRYGTPWPLSEDDYLCTYADDSKSHGLYWIDRHGNRELLYRDPAIPSMSPIPFRARAKPPVLPEGTTQTEKGLLALGDRPATISVMNVYESDFEWPENTQITALRVVQVLPKTTAPPNDPRIGVANQTNARAILGTVPVEEDGSAYFEAPVGKELYFQALDADGFAVQSMRSGTYVHPGEQLTCTGCHEPKQRSSESPGQMPIALGRAPSKIKPEVDGTNPFSYARLVQPVLDKNCVECHQKEEAPGLSGTPANEHHWSQSYISLAKDFGFYFNVSNGSIDDGVHGGVRSIAGEFGARASKLMDFLKDEHYGVSLTEEERHRFVLWLDSNSEFFGTYENTLAQAKGEIVHPVLD